CIRHAASVRPEPGSNSPIKIKQNLIDRHIIGPSPCGADNNMTNNEKSDSLILKQTDKNINVLFKNFTSSICSVFKELINVCCQTMSFAAEH
ncbi:hypothetical protein, partial [Paenibacillus sp. CMAA1364]